jgi:hypothetical protein
MLGCRVRYRGSDVGKGQYLPKSDVCITSVQPLITDSLRASRQVRFRAKLRHMRLFNHLVCQQLHLTGDG